MKIAFVSANLETGGIERVVNNLSNYLIKNGHEVHIIATKDGKCNYDMDEKIIRHVLTHDTTKGRIGRVVSKIQEFRHIIKTARFDVMLSFGSYVTMYTVAAAMMLGVRIIGSERTDPSVAPESEILRQLRNVAYRCTAGMVFQTDDARAYFSKRIQRKGTVIPNPIKEILPERWEGEREKEIVNFCRLNSQKNLPMLLHAFAAFHKTHPDYRLTIYGEGELKQDLLDLAGQLGISSCMEIRNFTSKIHDCILKSAMFVSSSDYEGISNSMLESMGIGLPCICTDCPVGGARMMIRHLENGMLVPVGNEKALTEAMNYVADHPAEAAEMGRRAVRIRDRLSVEKIAACWVEKIDAVMKQ